MNYMSLPGLPAMDERLDLIVSEIWDIHTEQLKLKTRKREVVEARQVLMSYRHTRLNMTLSKSAEPYGKDHTTVVHAVKTVNDLNDTDRIFRAKYSEFLKRAV